MRSGVLPFLKNPRAAIACDNVDSSAARDDDDARVSVDDDAVSSVSATATDDDKFSESMVPGVGSRSVNG